MDDCRNVHQDSPLESRNPTLADLSWLLTSLVSSGYRDWKQKFWRSRREFKFAAICMNGNPPKADEVKKYLLSITDVQERRRVINYRDAHGDTALHWAAATANKEVVELLLENHCETNALNSDKWTALHLASAKGHVEVVKLLAEHSECQVDVVDGNGGSWTPLHLAAQSNQVSVLQVLLKNGADIRLLDAMNMSALQRAAQNGHLEAARFLVEHGASLESEDKFGRTALYLSAMKDEFVETRQVLLAHGAVYAPKHLTTGKSL